MDWENITGWIFDKLLLSDQHELLPLPECDPTLTEYSVCLDVTDSIITPGSRPTEKLGPDPASLETD